MARHENGCRHRYDGGIAVCAHGARSAPSKKMAHAINDLAHSINAARAHAAAEARRQASGDCKRVALSVRQLSLSRYVAAAVAQNAASSIPLAGGAKPGNIWALKRNHRHRGAFGGKRGEACASAWPRRQQGGASCIIFAGFGQCREGFVVDGEIDWYARHDARRSSMSCRARWREGLRRRA